MLLLLFNPLSSLVTGAAQAAFLVDGAATGSHGVSAAADTALGFLANATGAHGVAGSADSALTLVSAGQSAVGASAAGTGLVGFQSIAAAARGNRASGAVVTVTSALGEAVFTPPLVYGSGAATALFIGAGAAHHTRLPVVGAGAALIPGFVATATGAHAIGASAAVLIGFLASGRAIIAPRGGGLPSGRPPGNATTARNRAPVAASRRNIESAAPRPEKHTPARRR